MEAIKIIYESILEQGGIEITSQYNLNLADLFLFCLESESWTKSFTRTCNNTDCWVH